MRPFLERKDTTADTPMTVERKAAWFDYVRKLDEAGVSIMNEADKMTVAADIRDPKVLAMALL